MKAPGILRRSMSGITPARCPTSKPARHAVSIDEKRCPLGEYLVDNSQTTIEEVWFAGVHSDIGGGFLEEPRLGDIALKWITDGARATGILLRQDRPFAPLTIGHAIAAIHRTGLKWALLTFRRRPVPPTAKIPASVQQRSAQQPRCGSKRLPLGSWADPNWLT